jgi:hypothetical protein
MKVGFEDIPMTDAKDYATLIASALDEVSVTGVLQVSVDDRKVIREIGGSNDDDVEVVVTVTPRTTTPSPQPRTT